MTILGRFLERRSISPLQAWIQDISYGNLSADSGLAVTQKNSTGLAAVYACTSLISETIATLPVDSYITWNGLPKVWRPRPTWMDEPVPNDPSQTWATHITMVVLSLLFDGNAFIHCLPSVLDPQVITVLDPNVVQVKADPNGRPLYIMRPQQGTGLVTFTTDDVVHIMRNVRPGYNRGMSPIDEARQPLGTFMAAQKSAGRFFRNGAKLSGVLESPAELTKDQADSLRDKFTAAHTGDNAYTVGVLTGGAKYTTIGVTPDQAQFLETMKFHTLEVARLFRVPPLLIQVNDPGAVSYASADAAVIEFEKHTVRPVVELLQSGYRRLMPHSKAYIDWDTRALLQGDPKTRFDSYAVGLEQGFFNRDEVRAWENMPPLPDGLGQKFTVPQRTIDLANLDDQQPIALPGPDPNNPADKGAPKQPDRPGMPMMSGAMK